MRRAVGGGICFRYEPSGLPIPEQPNLDGDGTKAGFQFSEEKSGVTIFISTIFKW